ncbi:MAG: hypothetical protein AAFZ15_07740 [Bacteroidota bacterium]
MKPNIENVSFLTLNFEGYFACRIATDPDPTNEERGMSGYTMALSTEDKLDQVIRLRVDDDYIKKNLRPPGELIGMDVNLKRGVVVTNVSYNDQSWSSNLSGAELDLKGKDGIFNGPIFESRNNVTGSDDNLSFVITPFQLHINGDDIQIEAIDILDPSADAPTQKIWQITDPSIYGRRLPTGFSSGDQEVSKAINVFDQYGYFRDRRRFMEGEIARLEALVLRGGPNVAQYQIEIEQYKSRIYQLEFWGDRVINKINLKVSWDFAINGPKKVSEDVSIWQYDKSKKKINETSLKPVQDGWDWPIQFWFGGWDGDLLTGYMRGQLQIPVTKN